jgi:hypothetical protein
MKTQCSTYKRLSKNSFLSLLGPKKFKKENSEIYGNKDKFIYKEKVEEISYDSSGCSSSFCYDDKYGSRKSRSFFENLTVPWSIKSFDPSSRSVCVEIKNKSTTVNIFVTLPPIIAK